jgi:hypothetical protein
MKIDIMTKLKKWYFRDYEARKREIESGVVARFARGNVLVQDGHYMTEDELRKLSKEADCALERLEKIA